MKRRERAHLMLPGLFLAAAACPPLERLAGGGGSPSRLPPILAALLALHSRAIEAGHQSRLGLQTRQRRGGRRRRCRGDEITVGFGFGFGGSGHQQAPGCQCHSPAHLSIPFPSLPPSLPFQLQFTIPNLHRYLTELVQTWAQN